MSYALLLPVLGLFISDRRFHFAAAISFFIIYDYPPIDQLISEDVNGPNDRQPIGFDFESKFQKGGKS